MRKVHLHKSGLGMAAKTACGRNILRTPIAARWTEFKTEPEKYQCDLCAASKQATLNARFDAKIV
jgi:hypothetical protein